MASADSVRITGLLNHLREGSTDAAAELVPLIYPELRKIAARHMRGERPSHTLQPTALVHEAYLRVIAQNKSWENRAHFFAVASRLMRQILVDHARKQRAAKRGGSAIVIDLPLEIKDAFTESQAGTVIDIDRALDQLALFDPRAAEIVVSRIFGGLREDEIAQVMGISLRTVHRDWQIAKAWLRKALSAQLPEQDADA